MIGIIFPGQGAQYVGMGKELYTNFDSAKEIFQTIDDKLDYALSDIIFNGPNDELIKPRNSQPATLALSVALFTILEKEFGYNTENNIASLAGHSLGEYSALVIAGSMTIRDAAKITHIRGRAMENAVLPGISGMGAIIGLDIIDIYQIAMECSNGDVVQVASYNCPGQVIISGHKPAVIRTLEKAKKLGAKNAILLNIDSAYHSSLMKPAAGEVEDIFETIKLKKPKIPIFFGYNAKAEPNHEKIKKRLIKGIYNQILWKEMIENIHKKKKVNHFLEIGPGNILSSLVKRILPKSKVNSIQSLKDIEQFCNNSK